MVRRVYRKGLIRIDALPTNRKCIKCNKDMELYVRYSSILKCGTVPLCTECYHKFLQGETYI